MCEAHCKPMQWVVHVLVPQMTVMKQPCAAVPAASKPDGLWVTPSRPSISTTCLTSAKTLSVCHLILFAAAC